MKLNTASAFAASLLLMMPVLAEAQTQGDTNPSPNQSMCLRLKNNLQYRSNDAATGGEVTKLQAFLQSGGYVSTEPTGHFGLATQAAVMRFQKAMNILSSGYVGPATRAKIAAASCDGIATNQVPTTPSRLPDGCRPGDRFSSKTGEYCDTTVACTQEVKMCPDGSYVGRIAPSCAFKPCAATSAAPSLVVTSPNGGEKYAQGTPITFNWTQNYKGVNLKARIFDVVSGYEYYSGPIGGGTGGIGKNLDTLPAEASNIPAYPLRYRLTICDEGTPNPAVPFKNLCDSSDTAFSIASQGKAPSCTLKTDKSSYKLGDTIVFSWTSKNATFTNFQQNSSGKDTLLLPGDKLDVKGSQTVTASVLGNPVVTLLVHNYDSTNSCSATVAVSTEEASPSVVGTFSYRQLAGPRYDRGQIHATYKYSINKYSKNLVIDVEPTVNCNDAYIAPLKRDCSGYHFDLAGKAAESYIGVVANPYVKGGASYRFTGVDGVLNINGYIPKVNVDTNPAGYTNPIPDSIDFKFILRDRKQGGKEIWSTTERVQFKG